MEPFQGTKEFLDKAQQLHTHLSKYDTDIQQKKLKKYQRDIKDFEQNQVYKWQTDLIPTNPNVPPVQRDLEIHNAVSQLAKDFNKRATPHTPVRTSNKSVSYPKNNPPQRGRNYPPQNNNNYPYPAPYMVPTHNRFAPLSNRPSDYDYQYHNPEHNYYQPRPPRGNHRGNY